MKHVRKRMLVFFDERKTPATGAGNVNARTAWAKAPGDVAEVLQRDFGADVLTVPHREYSMAGKFWQRVVFRLKWDFTRLRLLWNFPRRRFVIIQGHFVFMYKMLGCRYIDWLLRLKGCDYAFLIHDMPGHMIGDDYGETPLPEGFDRLAARARGIIVHNTAMAEWFADAFRKAGLPQGVSKIVSLECFDYLAGEEATPIFSRGDAELAGPQRDFSKKKLCASEDSASLREKNDASATPNTKPDEWRKVVYAGNLSSKKSPFLDLLGEVQRLSIELYGAPPRESKGGVVYRGAKPPDELPAALTDGFGLVWDGDSVETCSGGSGTYLAYNNPHKLSLYLAAGLPVAIWSGAAQARFVTENNAGIAVDSLRDLAEKLSAMPADEYRRLKAGAGRVGALLRQGHYTARAVRALLGEQG